MEEIEKMANELTQEQIRDLGVRARCLHSAPAASSPAVVAVVMTLRDTNGDELITSGLMQSSYEITLTETAPAVMAVQCSSRAFAAGVVQENVNPLIVQPGDLVHFATPRGDNELRTLMGAESTLPECPMQGPPNLHDGDRVFGKPTLTGRILPDNGNERRVYLNFLLNGQKFSHVLTFAGSEGSFQNAHWHKGFEEVYKVVKGTMIFVELCPETLRYTFRTYGPGEVVQSRPGVPHNVYLNGGAIIWTGKVLIEPVENDWTACKHMTTFTRDFELPEGALEHGWTHTSEILRPSKW